MLKFTLTSGDVLTGTPNYVTITHAEIRLSDGSYVWVERGSIAATARAAR